jgi:hypothetical protein
VADLIHVPVTVAACQYAACRNTRKTRILQPDPPQVEDWCASIVLIKLRMERLKDLRWKSF